MSHSPFPWSQHRHVPTCVYDADGKRIASPSINIDPETAADNAALIAAIPAMIEALQAIVKHMDKNGMQDWPVAKKARAVLASIGKKP